ncbi:MAG: agmatine deiminase family protein, partial [Bacteroidota bacterium]
GHTDEFVRFVNDTTILLAWVEAEEAHNHPIAAINAGRMQENMRILRASTDQDGRPLQIIKCPLPDPITKSVQVVEQLKDPFAMNLKWDWFVEKETVSPGDSVERMPAASYLNYLVCNEAVILPTYVKAGSSRQKEEQVLAIMKRVFPERKIIQLDVMNLNYYGGGIHCITQQEPLAR